MQKYKYFPYAQLSNFAKIATSNVRRLYLDPKEVPSRQYSYDTEKTVLDKNIDTALLPLKIKGIRISDHYPVPKVAGGITTIGDIVIVLDRLGNIYSCRPDEGIIAKLPFPALPNNIDDYVLQPGARLDVRTFRSYSIKFMDTAKLLAVSHEYYDKQYRKTRMAVSVISIDTNSIRPIGAWRTIWLSDAEPEGPNEASGGKLATDGSDKIVLTVGDYLIPAPIVAQDPNSTFGKIIEISVSTQTVKKLSLGHRNPQGLVLTRTGALLSTEHGPAGGDELNLITEGSNYGWPNVTLGTDYGTYGWKEDSLVGKHTDYTAPLFAWVPAIAVSNLIQVEGFHPRWEGDLLVASLKAETLFRLRWVGTKILYSEPIWIGQRIRDIAQLKNGTLVLWTDDTQLQFISVDQEKLETNKRPSVSISSVMYSACMFCHHFGSTNVTDAAPTLSNLFERKIGSDNFRYSAALRNKEGTWTEKNLREFLSKPDKFANGTSMPQPTLNQEDIDEIIQALKNVQDNKK
jgi:cytochrome c2